MSEAREAGRPACFLDRDGVLNVDTGYAYRPDQLVLTPTAGPAVRRLNDAGFLVVVVTNQSGVARGLFGMEDVHRFHRELQRQLTGFGAHIDAFYIAPQHPDGTVERFAVDHPDRKPGSGMLLRAMTDFPIDREASFLIGDKASDVEAGTRVGIKSVLIPANVGDLDDMVATLLGRSGGSPSVPFPSR